MGAFRWRLLAGALVTFADGVFATWQFSSPSLATLIRHVRLFTGDDASFALSLASSSAMRALIFSSSSINAAFGSAGGAGVALDFLSSGESASRLSWCWRNRVWCGSPVLCFGNAPITKQIMKTPESLRQTQVLAFISTSHLFCPRAQDCWPSSCEVKSHCI